MSGGELPYQSEENLLQDTEDEEVEYRERSIFRKDKTLEPNLKTVFFENFEWNGSLEGYGLENRMN